MNNATGTPEALPRRSDLPEVLRTTRYRFSVDTLTIVAIIVIRIVFEIIAVKLGALIMIAGPDVMITIVDLGLSRPSGLVSAEQARQSVHCPYVDSAFENLSP